MKDTASKTLRAALALSVVLLSPGLSAYAAAAESVSIKLSGPVVSGPLNTNIVLPVRTPELGVGVLPQLDPAAVAAVQIPTAEAAAVPTLLRPQAVAAEPVAALEARALTATSPQAPSGVMAALSETQAQKPEAPTAAAASAETSGSRWSRLFDNVLRRRGTADVPVLAGGSSLTRPVLNKASAAAPAVKTAAVPAPKSAGRGVARVGKALALGAVLLLATAGVAMAAPVAVAAAAPVVGIESLGFIAAYQPLATAAAAVAGAVYGLIAANKKGQATTAELIASVMRYGILAGSGSYILLTLTQGVFIGFAAIGLHPLPSALATAALGQGAFQGKFTDPNSSSADRIMNAFPAVAAALGLSVGAVALTSVAAPLALAAGAMSMTGVAAALFTALYKPGVSPAEGPAKVARGFVLQSLMAGLALSVANPYAALAFAGLAAWGFWDVLAATAREAYAALPEAFKQRFNK